MEPLIGAAPAKAGADLIKNSSTAAFMADVIDASNEQPVIVDFWAPWCGPCKTLGPQLEKAVKDARGSVREDQHLQERVGREPVCPVDPGRCDLAYRPESRSGRSTLKVRGAPPHGVMEGRRYRDQIPAGIETMAAQQVGYAREAVLEPRHVTSVEPGPSRSVRASDVAR